MSSLMKQFCSILDSGCQLMPETIVFYSQYTITMKSINVHCDAIISSAVVQGIKVDLSVISCIEMRPEVQCQV